MQSTVRRDAQILKPNYAQCVQEDELTGYQIAKLIAGQNLSDRTTPPEFKRVSDCLYNLLEDGKFSFEGEFTLTNRKRPSSIRRVCLGGYLRDCSYGTPLNGAEKRKVLKQVKIKTKELYESQSKIGLILPGAFQDALEKRFGESEASEEELSVTAGECLTDGVNETSTVLTSPCQKTKYVSYVPSAFFDSNMFSLDTDAIGNLEGVTGSIDNDFGFAIETEIDAEEKNDDTVIASGKFENRESELEKKITPRKRNMESKSLTQKAYAVLGA